MVTSIVTANRTMVVLDRKLTASQACISSEIRMILTGLLKEALVGVMNDKYHYLVDFGPNVQPQVHIVSWDLACICLLEEDCLAVTAVKKYLQDGGRVAEIRRTKDFFEFHEFLPLLSFSIAIRNTNGRLSNTDGNSRL